MDPWELIMSCILAENRQYMDDADVAYIVVFGGSHGKLAGYMTEAIFLPEHEQFLATEGGAWSAAAW